MTSTEPSARRAKRQAAINDHFSRRMARDRAQLAERLLTRARDIAEGKVAPRKAIIEIEGAGVDIRFAEIDNPFYARAHREDRTNPRKVQAARNINESPLVRLEALGTIDSAQAAAGHRFRALVERLMSGRVSPSLIQERVDGQAASDVFTESRLRASFSLAQAAGEMTPAEFWAVHFVCGEGRSLNDLARAGRWRKARAREFLVASLERLAEVWGVRAANDQRARR